MKKIILITTLLLGIFILNPQHKIFSTNEIAVISRGNFEFFWSNQPGVLDKTIASDTTETYNPNERKWNGLPAITITPGGRLWAVWMTGGMLEPDKHNYNVMYYSDDFGNTWSEEFLILKATDEEKQIYTPNLFVDPEGNMWFYINYGGTHGIIIKNPDCKNPSKELELSPSVIGLTNYPMAHIPTILSSGVWLVPVESKSHLLTQQIYASTNKVLWEPFSSITTCSPAIKRFNESQIVELSDKRLMILSRLDGGSGIERAYSKNGGSSWTAFETDLEEPYIGPGSKFEIRKLKSGSILMINHNSTSSREKLTAYLSKDDGETWPYKLVLDDRKLNVGYWGVSYPNFTEGSDGTIYVVWDQRTPLVEINLARFTENDLISGKLSETSFTYKNIVRNSDYLDIKTVLGIEKRTYNYELGIKANEIIAKLPTKLKLVNSNNESLVVTGEFTIKNFDSNKEGTYEAYFVTDEIPEKWIDSYELLKVDIIIKEKQNNKLPLFLVIFSSITILGVIIIVIINKILKRKKGETK
jgi:hypothetical protein